MSGLHHEEPIARPGHRWPWVLVVQEDDVTGRLVWGAYSQASTRPTWTGSATTIEQARRQGRAAAGLASPETPLEAP